MYRNFNYKVYISTVKQKFLQIFYNEKGKDSKDSEEPCVALGNQQEIG